MCRFGPDALRVWTPLSLQTPRMRHHPTTAFLSYRQYVSLVLDHASEVAHHNIILHFFPAFTNLGDAFGLP